LNVILPWTTPHAASAGAFVIDSFPAALERLLERRRTPILLLFGALFLATTASRAEAKPFWHDEIFTIALSRLPSVKTMWRASLDGLDLSPPLNTWLTRVIHGFFGVGRVTTRLPPMIGYGAMCGALFPLVRRRATTTLAFAAMVLPCFTAGYRYAYEARGYGLMMGLFACVLLCWSEAAAGRRRSITVPLLALTLSASLWNHYYAILTVVPIGVGELVRLTRTRRPDWPVWAAIGCALLSVVPLVPLLRVAGSQASGYWSLAAWRCPSPDVACGDIAATYDFLLAPLGDLALTVTHDPFRVTLTFLGALVALAMASGWFGRRRPVERHQPIPAHEIAAGLTTLLIPLCGVAVGVFVTGAFTPRYTLSTIAGICLVVPLLVHRSSPRSAMAGAVLCVTLVGTFLWSCQGGWFPDPSRFYNPTWIKPVVMARLAGPEPVVMTSGLQYPQTWYYMPPDRQMKLWYIADPALSLKNTGSDTMDRGLLALARWTPVPVLDYQTFLAQPPRVFYLYTVDYHWLIDDLQRRGATLDDAGHDGAFVLFRVTMKP
jgi:hypothetical protein